MRRTNRIISHLFCVNTTKMMNIYDEFAESGNNITEEVEEDMLSQVSAETALTEYSNKSYEAVTSFRDMVFDSEAVKTFVKMQGGEDFTKKKISMPVYKDTELFPDWMLSSEDWKGVQEATSGFQLSKILQKSQV